MVLNMSKFKVFADDNLNMGEMKEFVIDELENIVGKGDLLVTSNFYPIKFKLLAITQTGFNCWKWH